MFQLDTQRKNNKVKLNAHFYMKHMYLQSASISKTTFLAFWQCQKDSTQSKNIFNTKSQCQMFLKLL